MYPLAARGEATASGRSITPLTALSQPASIERVFDIRTGTSGGIDVPLAESRWNAIVIHHSGSPVCTAATIDRRHRAAGLMGMGYHFVIGNGRRMGDGELHIGDRWAGQAPGAHVAGEAGLTLNRSAIGICLVGDGNRTEFTRPQSQKLIELVSRLCERLDIPPSRVFMHRDVAHTTSPGRLFPEAGLRAYLSGR
ncbi:MAG: peptidoglycan recognition family protein [Planctomycetota bacterium]